MKRNKAIQYQMNRSKYGIPRFDFMRIVIMTSAIYGTGLYLIQKALHQWHF